MLTVEVGFPESLGKLTWVQDGYSISEPSERGDLVQNPRWRRSKDFHVQLCFWDIEWLRTKIPKKTEETKNVLDTWQLGPSAVSRLRTKNTKRKWKTSRLGASVFDVTVSFCALEAAFSEGGASWCAHARAWNMADAVWELGDFLWWMTPESKVFMSCNYCSRWWWLVEVLFAPFLWVTVRSLSFSSSSQNSFDLYTRSCPQ